MAIISSQSAGALVSLLAATAATMAFTAVRRGPGTTGPRHRVPLLVLAGLFAFGFPFVLTYLVEFKMSGDVSVLTGRGLGFLSGIQRSAKRPASR